MCTAEVDDTIQRIIKLFYQVGIWQRDDESPLRKASKKFFHTAFGAVYPIFMMTNAFLCGDRNESIYSVQLTIIALVVYVKYLYVLFKKPEILAFLYDNTVVRSIDNRADYDQIKKKIGGFMKFVRPFIAALFITCPLVIVVKLPMFSGDKMLPMFVSFTWNDSEIIYWLVFVYFALVLPLYALASLITIIIWYVMFNYSIEYQLLGNKLRNLGMRTKNVKTGVENEKRITLTSPSFVENLIVCVKAHRNLTKTIRRFKACCSTLFLFQYTTSGIGICGSVYNLAFVSDDNIFQIELYGLLLIYALFDIFWIMYMANEITDASDRLSYCLFESSWTDRSESCKKYVLIMGEVLKQPQQLVILIYPMNLTSFMSIVNGGYKMFNIMKKFQ